MYLIIASQARQLQQLVDSDIDDFVKIRAWHTSY